MADLFETGQRYIFYLCYGNKMNIQEINGQVVSYEHPLVKIETNGLTRIINCSSSSFIEAISRHQGDEIEELVLDQASLQIA